jgi:hypothetical protein
MYYIYSSLIFSNLEFSINLVHWLQSCRQLGKAATEARSPLTGREGAIASDNQFPHFQASDNNVVSSANDVFTFQNDSDSETAILLIHCQLPGTLGFKSNSLVMADLDSGAY